MALGARAGGKVADARHPSRVACLADTAAERAPAGKPAPGIARPRHKARDMSKTTLLDAQPLDRPAVPEMLLDDLVDIALTGVAVPDPFGIDDNRRPLAAAIEATGLVYPHLAAPVEPERLDPRLGVVAHCHSPLVGAARLAVVALVDAEEYVIAVIRFGHGTHPRPIGR